MKMSLSRYNDFKIHGPKLQLNTTYKSFFFLKEIKRIDGKETRLNEIYNFHKRDRKDLLLNLTQSLSMITGLIYLSCLTVTLNFK